MEERLMEIDKHAEDLRAEAACIADKIEGLKAKMADGALTGTVNQTAKAKIASLRLDLEACETAAGRLAAERSRVAGEARAQQIRRQIAEAEEECRSVLEDFRALDGAAEEFAGRLRAFDAHFKAFARLCGGHNHTLKTRLTVLLQNHVGLGVLDLPHFGASHARRVSADNTASWIEGIYTRRAGELRQELEKI